MLLEIIALTVTAYLAGLLTAGMIIRHHLRTTAQEAPAPIDIGYDPTNPINRGRYEDPVEVDGVRLWRIC